MSSDKNFPLGIIGYIYVSIALIIIAGLIFWITFFPMINSIGNSMNTFSPGI